MEYTLLIKLGLNKNEAKVYLALLKRGSASAGEIIRETEFHRNIVYDNLEKLVDKGLVSYILEGNVKIFQINSSENIIQMLEKEQRGLDEKKKIAEDVRKEIAKIVSKHKSKQEAKIFRGVEGMKVLFKDTLYEGVDHFVFGAPKASLDIMGETYWENYNVKREQKKILIKMIFNEDLREWSKKVESLLTKIKFLPKRFDSLTETMVYGDSVAIIVWSEKPIATLIRDKNIARSYRQYFDILWRQAKK